MTSREFKERLTRRATLAGIPVPADAHLEQLERYLTLLSKWKAKINLTALPLQPPTDEALDRLFIEPLVAAGRFPEAPVNWIDLGSGGGSPAIPLKIVQPLSTLTMVDAKVRKAAFLREVIRVLALPKATVENARFEEIVARLPGVARLVTVRAVRVDRSLTEVLAELLEPNGQLFMFRRDAAVPRLPGFSAVDTVPVRGSSRACVMIYRRIVPRGTSGGRD